MLKHGLSNALNHATVHLTFYNHGITDDPKVIYRDEIDNLNDTGIWVYLDFTNMGTRREVKVRGVKETRGFEPWFQIIRGKVMRGVSVKSHIPESKALVRTRA